MALTGGHYADHCTVGGVAELVDGCHQVWGLVIAVSVLSHWSKYGRVRHGIRDRSHRRQAMNEAQAANFTTAVSIFGEYQNFQSKQQLTP